MQSYGDLYLTFLAHGLLNPLKTNTSINLSPTNNEIDWESMSTFSLSGINTSVVTHDVSCVTLQSFNSVYARLLKLINTCWHFRGVLNREELSHMSSWFPKALLWSLFVYQRSRL
jgi:hypothetical protein